MVDKKNIYDQTWKYVRKWMSIKQKTGTKNNTVSMPWQVTSFQRFHLWKGRFRVAYIKALVKTLCNIKAFLLSAPFGMKLLDEILPLTSLLFQGEIFSEALSFIKKLIPFCGPLRLNKKWELFWEHFS